MLAARLETEVRGTPHMALATWIQREFFHWMDGVTVHDFAIEAKDGKENDACCFGWRLDSFRQRLP